MGQENLLNNSVTYCAILLKFGRLLRYGSIVIKSDKDWRDGASIGNA